MDRYLLTPYFLDQEKPALDTVFPSDWSRNQPQLPTGNTMKRMGALHRPIAEFVARAANVGDRPVSIGGDCCTAIGVLAGLQYASISPTVLWLDAHGDFNTFETTPSGFLGGMPLAMLVGRGDQTLVDNVALSHLPEAQVVLADARDLDPGELAALKKSAIRRLVQFKDLLSWDWGDRPIYVHFDTDLLDPNDMPATGYPAPGGPPPELIRQLFMQLRDSRQVVAISVAAWSPELDEDGKSAELVIDLLNSLL